MPKLLTSTQAAQYERDGFVSPLRVMSLEDASRYRARFEHYEAANGGWYEQSKGQKIYLVQTWVAELVSDPRVLDAVEDVLGPDLMCWGVSLFVKEARSPGYVSWHQDSTYWGLSEPAVVTAWVALSPATCQSGCMKMLPGSQNLDQVAHHDTLHRDNLLTRGQEIAMEVDETRSVACPLEPGEISLHNIRTVHASEPNRSDDRRIGVAIRYIAPRVRQVASERDSAWLVRGEDRFGNFVHERPPKADMDPEALAERDRVMALRQGVLYRDVKGKPAHTDL
ncbi:MAG: phytanoyl-CoA dioxygenase family protein [Ectothiorhodospiraceae bacterium]|nr:phytanoyl-CoA dioxygenase family protein [Chromatiales bacterium]MCP5156011.1 phytanoyl-CoA dioxygenase family protein [Ectothiorhodospiraceae bacterium]